MAALLGALRSKLHGCAPLCLRGDSFHARSSSLSLPASVLVVLLCATAFSRVVVFFLPLVASTSLCCAAVYLLVAASDPDQEGGAAAKEVVLVRGDRAEVGVLQVFDGANATVYAAAAGRRVDAMRVACFLHYRPRGAAGGGGWTKRGVDEDGEEVVFAGRLAAVCGQGDDDGDGGRDLEEELAALRVDRLAEGVWDSYFGGWSRWNYVTDGHYDEGATIFLDS
uniref:Uncharacterized protein n=1 Tax=Oryza punctata TaxID=4537 RepID=A0A0E0JGD2_ORYPU